MLDRKDLECLQEILNEEILSYIQSGYKITDDYVVLCRNILKKLNLKEIYNFEYAESIIEKEKTNDNN